MPDSLRPFIVCYSVLPPAAECFVFRRRRANYQLAFLTPGIWPL